MRGIFNDDRKRWRRDAHQRAFWLFAFVFILIGGATAYTHGYGGSARLTPFLAMNVGFTWPLLLRRGAKALPDTDLGPVD